MAGNTTELLGLLRDIRVPEPPAEPATWPLFMALLVIATGLTCVLVLYRRHRCRWSIQARRLIAEVQQQAPEQAVQSYAQILRRVVLTLQPGSDARGLQGERWLQLLDDVFHTDYFTHRQGRVFGTELYRKHSLTPDDRDLMATTLNKLLWRRSWRQW